MTDRTPIRSLRLRAPALWVMAAVIGASALQGQEPPARGEDSLAAVLDTVIVERHDIFTPDVAATSFLYRLMNSLHIVTKPWVIERELLLGVGDPYDSVSAQESERNLRARGLFSEVDIDTMRVDGLLALHARTVDAWSTQPRLTFSIASNGTLTGVAGITESNLLGTGAGMRVWYRKDVDRDGLDLAAAINRVAGTKLAISGSFLGLSDQTIGRWRIGAPFYALSERRAAEYSGEVFDGRVLQFRTVDPAAPDTAFWAREAFVHRVVGAVAPSASSSGYLRLGLLAELRREAYSLQRDSTAIVPDSLYGLVGGFVEYLKADFREMRYFNGFAREDQALGLLISLTAKLAPSGWGYPSTGIGPRVLIQAGTAIGNGLIKGLVDANALFNSAGLDSGRVVGRLTVGYKPGVRHAMIASVEGGVLDGPPPGGEFDLGFRTPPRLWDPHAFTGNRSVRATLEHRWYVWDRVLNLIGIGVAGFLDYGGAWYDDQEARYGGNVGVALLFGSSLSALAQNGQMNVGYRFGKGVQGSRVRLSFGSGLIF